ncbi:MAG: peptidoglycan-binding protein, partial [Candidatus Tectomicrobia bacterium]
RLVAIGARPGKQRPAGELLPLDLVDLRLSAYPDLTLPEPDPAFNAQIKNLLGAKVSRYGVAVLDLTDPNNPRYAEINGDTKQNPGSVGKILVALGLFQALADIYPDDLEARRRVLREAMITADVFSHYDHHTVRLWDPESGNITRRPIHDGDRASLWTYLDWMMSPSSNSAAGMLQKHLLLLVHYGKDYPVSDEEKARFFKETPKKSLREIFARAIQDPVTRNGLDIKALRQGSFFTRGGKQQVPGTNSYATSRELMRYLLRMEQGKLVDAFSSREIKRLLYITERRIRYASSPALRQAAVYFKSGSLYKCKPEPNFTCRKYHGNVRNFMNSAAIVESPAGQNRLYYMSTLLSNVLRQNSAVDHQTLGTRIHRLLQAEHPAPPPQRGPDGKVMVFGDKLIGFAEKRRELQLITDTQIALLQLGYRIGSADGIVGAKTRGAIKAYQQAHDLRANGKMTQALYDHMTKTLAQKSSPAR